jgi:hypothetical protein
LSSAGNYRQGIFLPEGLPGFMSTPMYLFVQYLSLGSKAIFLPDALKVYEGVLPFAE